MKGEEGLARGHRYEKGKRKLCASAPSFGPQSQWVEMLWIGIWTPSYDPKLGALISQISENKETEEHGGWGVERQGEPSPEWSVWFSLLQQDLKSKRERSRGYDC